MPITSSQRRKLSRTIQKIIKQGDRLDSASAQSFLATLKSTRSRIISEIKMAEAWDLSNLRRIKGSIDLAIDRLSTEALDSLSGFQTQSWAIGKSIVDKPLEAMGITIGLPELTETQLLALQLTSTELIAGLSADMRSKIRVAIDQAILGELSPFRAGQKVDAVIEGIGNRGERIIRTEVGRASSVASQMRMEQSGEFVPKLKKEWLPGPYTIRQRPTHLAMAGQVQDIDKPFDLRNDRTGEIEHPMFPKDPNLSAYNSVNCRCTSIPYSEDWV